MNRERSFNIGEREVAELLEELGYEFKTALERGYWTPKLTEDMLPYQELLTVYEESQTYPNCV